MLKLDQLINPFGKGQAVFAYRNHIKELSRRYEEKIKDLISVQVLEYQNSYFFLVKVPSESNDKNPKTTIFYDVLFEFIPANPFMRENHATIMDYDIKLYSNDPAFIYTFTYVYYIKRHLITMPSGYYSRYAQKKPANVRNPYEMVGVTKTVFFAIHYLQSNHRFDKTWLKENSIQKMTKTAFLKLAATQDEKMLEVQQRQMLDRQHAEREKKMRKDLKHDRIEKEKKSLTEELKNLKEQQKTELQSGLTSDMSESKLKGDLVSKSLHSLLSNKPKNEVIYNIKESNDRTSRPLRANLKSSLSKR